VDISQIRTLLTWMQSIELDAGDLTTETISPYALHSAGSALALSEGLFAGREVLEVLFEESGNGDPFESGDIFFEFNGNGAEILKNRRLIQWIIGRMAGVATATREAAKLLQASGKILVQGITVNPIFEIFDAQAFETGGGIWKRQGLTDSIYVTQAHFHYAGGVEKCLEQINQEIGNGLMNWIMTTCI